MHSILTEVTRSSPVTRRKATQAWQRCSPMRLEEQLSWLEEQLSWLEEQLSRVGGVPEMDNDKNKIPDKLFFKIGEAAQLVGVKPHVLRYWESEFRDLRPMKTRGSHRVYRRQDVELAIAIRRLVQDDGFTISGAKKRLRQGAETREAASGVAEASGSEGWKSAMGAVRGELAQFLARVEHRGEEEQQDVFTEQHPQDSEVAWAEAEGRKHSSSGQSSESSKDDYEA